MRGNRQYKLDANHTAVVDALRKAGISVVSLAMVGKGCGDLLCGYRGVNVLIELKDGAKPRSGRRLTADELEFSASWRGQWSEAHSAEEAILQVREYAAGMIG